MEGYKTVTQVSKEYAVSPRMLRYYEKLGLIESRHCDDYSYRIYDMDTIGRIRIILLLRKLRIPLKDIKVILTDKRQKQILDILQRRISEIDEEVESVSTIRRVLMMLVDKYREENNTYSLLDDLETVEIIDSVAPAKTQLQEVVTMTDLNKADSVLSMDMRIGLPFRQTWICRKDLKENRCRVVCMQLLPSISRSFIYGRIL